GDRQGVANREIGERMPGRPPQPFQAIADADDLQGEHACLAWVLGEDRPSGSQSGARLPLDRVGPTSRFGRAGDDLLDDALVHAVQQTLSAAEGLIEVAGVQRCRRAHGPDRRAGVSLGSEQLEAGLHESLAPLSPTLGRGYPSVSPGGLGSRSHPPILARPRCATRETGTAPASARHREFSATRGETKWYESATFCAEHVPRLRQAAGPGRPWRRGLAPAGARACAREGRSGAQPKSRIGRWVVSHRRGVAWAAPMLSVLAVFVIASGAAASPVVGPSGPAFYTPPSPLPGGAP